MGEDEGRMGRPEGEGAQRRFPACDGGDPWRPSDHADEGRACSAENAYERKPVDSEAYDRSLFCGRLAPLVSPTPTGAMPVGVGADVPSPSAPVRRDKPSTPRVGPYAGDSEKDQIETAPPGLSGRLAEAKRKAMLPFRGGVTGTMDNVEAVAQAARATLLDDDPDEELTRAGPGKTAASPGLGRME